MKLYKLTILDKMNHKKYYYRILAKNRYQAIINLRSNFIDYQIDRSNLKLLEVIQIKKV